MQKSFFETTRILDGGMGQELLAQGFQPRGTLWAADALIQEQYHPLVIDTHKAFIQAGAEVITTATFTARPGRLRQNQCESLLEPINKKAIELANIARDQTNKDVLISGGLPNQKQTYSADLGNDLDEIRNRFHQHANALKDGIDFFYLDVMNSIQECQIALDAVQPSGLPVLVGVHLRSDGTLPSGESVSELFNACYNDQWLGFIGACISPEAYAAAQPAFKSLNIPYGFKLNAFKGIPDQYEVSSAHFWGDSGNPNEILGINKALKDIENFKAYVKAFRDNGATILGGCCEIGPDHIRAIANLKH